MTIRPQITPLFDYEYCAVCFHPIHKYGQCTAIEEYKPHKRLCGCIEPVTQAERGAKVIHIHFPNEVPKKWQK